MTTTLTVADRLASISTDEKIVAGNTYPVTISTDAEWTGTYYLRIRFGSLYYDIPVSGSTVDVQIPVGYPEVGIGLYSDALGICTNEARIKVLRSILEQGVSVVEFDTDLYNQWQNEVSELVCDDDFDASSVKPLKNSVITAWKNSLPETVNLTGNQTIAGIKTFTDSVSCNNLLNVGVGYNLCVGNRLAMFDADGLTMTATGIYATHGNAQIEFDEVLTCPTYDGDNALAVVNKTMLADDTSIVRVTGNQSIAGTKTFSDGIVSDDVTTKALTVHGNSQMLLGTIALFPNSQGGIIGFTDIGNRTVEIIQGHDSDDNCYLRQYPATYYPTNDGVAVAPDTDVIMTSGLVAVDPRIVHTTGNEVVAGDKTFNNAVISNNCFYGKHSLDNTNASTGYQKVWSIKVEKTNTGGNFGLTLLGTGMRVGLRGHNCLSLSQVSLRNGSIDWNFLIRGENVNLSEHYVVKKEYTEDGVDYFECEGYVSKANNSQKFFVALTDTSNASYATSDSRFTMDDTIVSELPTTTETVTVTTTNATSMNGIL